MSANNRIVLNVNDWDTTAIKYMKPRLLDKGSKSISIISKQTNRMLHLTTPLLMTWGISDFTDEKGDSDGKFSISLNFPNDEYSTESTDAFLKKLQDFEDQILDDAEKMSMEWWGKKMSREICKFSMYPILKKNKDPSRPPSIRAKVPLYDGKWKVEIYNTKQEMIYPCEDESLTPIDFVPKLSNVACGLQCAGIWIGGKGWGVTWKLFQCVVKPREVVSIRGCCIELSPDDKKMIDKQEIPVVEEEEHFEQPVQFKKSVKPVFEKPPSTIVDDSDDEKEAEEPEPEPKVVDVAAVVPEPEPAVEIKQPETEQEPENPVEIPTPHVPAAAPPAQVKKVVKKTLPLPPTPTPPVLQPETEPVNAPIPEIKKKTTVVKKKVV
jgi:hypothetical protein